MILLDSIMIILNDSFNEDWSAPCAFALTSSTNTVAQSQHTLLLFMTPRSIISLVRNDTIVLGK